MASFIKPRLTFGGHGYRRKLFSDEDTSGRGYMMAGGALAGGGLGVGINYLHGKKKVKEALGNKIEKSAERLDAAEARRKISKGKSSWNPLNWLEKYRSKRELTKATKEAGALEKASNNIFKDNTKFKKWGAIGAAAGLGAGYLGYRAVKSRRQFEDDDY